MIIGIEFTSKTVEGRTYVRIAPVGLNIHKAVACLFIIAFAWVAMEITDVPPVQPTYDLSGVAR